MFNCSTTLTTHRWNIKEAISLKTKGEKSSIYLRGFISMVDSILECFICIYIAFFLPFSTFRLPVEISAIGFGVFVVVVDIFMLFSVDFIKFNFSFK